MNAIWEAKKLYSANEEVFEPEHSADESNLDRVGEELIPADCSALEEDDYPDFTAILTGDSDLDERLIRHKLWLKEIRHEMPSKAHPFKVGIYIRYFNQTKYENYLEYHIQLFKDTVALCPKWTLVDFYIDEGQSAPNMESAPEWVRLLGDCFSGKVDLIITQKVSNVSRTPEEITFVSRILAAQEHPVGIYFISEDIFTLASYYLNDLFDTELFPDNWELLADDELDIRPLLPGGVSD